MKHESAYATKKDFNQARLGYPFLACCNLCGEETGEIFLKRKGHGTREDLPRFMIGEDPCEFCYQAGAFRHHLGIEPGDTSQGRHGIAKLVSRDKKSGVDTPLAYITFSDQENRNILLAPDGEGTLDENKHAVKLQHRMIINGTRQMMLDDAGIDKGYEFTFIDILDPGIE